MQQNNSLLGLDKNSYALLGNVLCKGSGLKAYAEIKLSRTIDGQPTETKVFRYNIGALEQIIAETNRQVGHNVVAGRSNPVGINKGLRTTYGTIVFQQFDAGMLYEMFKEVKKWNYETKTLEEASLNGFSFEDYSLLEEDAALMSGAKDDLEINLYNSEVTSLLDLPPIDIFMVAAGDQIDPTTGVYEKNNTYIFKCNKVSFMSETFGISAGAPLHKVATKVLILGSIEPWHKVENGGNV